ncbi:50S ribosomal protein L11 methyltransferase [Phocaeicola faecicola]|jgi:ribosomal protein L11 methyltransferase|uniref:50S ribosomal protein L11 methyltransferase n=1 Tax=Phocaeicola faecicola TaxID=2739389 RepID=UPI0015B4E4EB|nr:50S ribosomal protein L11 methyltransferase [Phocaeicola faecicola]MCI5743984.1 50S ribosomal protein L11 methyltransferase [Bacteroides sp.]MDY4871275.1 50S ribosomal protein L11 methyltransferase [Phocaeicola faecicola]
MKYFEVTFTILPYSETASDVLSALTAEIGFESFVECEGGMQAYVQQSLFDEAALKAILSDFPMPDTQITYTITEPEDKNWNEEWEKNFFQPIVIEGRCVIHSTFHKDYPKAEYDIVINPQMAFGTGHHETTSSILGALLEADLKGKSVLDMGCGTSILAILASMRGADRVTAIDIDDWCVNNSRDNIALNHLNNITVELGDASLLKGREPFDVVIANINRNILLNDMHAYVDCMHSGSEIYMSGFYVEDIDAIRQCGENLGLEFVGYREKNRWAAVKLIKK